jgi:AraC-like DNA-binding protein
MIHGVDHSSSANFDSVVTRIILELFEEQAGSPTIVAVADRAGINVRTLQRRLEAAGVRFRDVVGECRQLRAQRELRNGKLPLFEISERLGYSDPSHFARAFRRWTGYSPSEYRRRMLKNP